MDVQTSSAKPDIDHVIGMDRNKALLTRWQVWLAAGLLAVGLLAFYVLRPSGSSTIQYQFAEVKKGDLTVSVTATGVLQPVNQVDVGTEVSGTVQSVEADYNVKVTAGQVLAKLDTAQLSAKLRQSEAALELARAKVLEMDATLKEMRNRVVRSRELEKKGLCSKEDCDAAEAAFTRAQATLTSAKAQVTQAAAQVDVDRTALSKAEIRSPINGIVLKRQVEPGQTVAASLQTPVLFTLAENLAQMALHVAVDEADVGQVEEGQEATFTVDAYPGRSFPAKITQVRFAPQTVEGVVTYETVLAVDNQSLLLRPGMTATANIIVAQRNDVVLIPNAALRFTPPSQAAKRQSTGLVSSLLPRPPRRSADENRKTGNGEKRVWIMSSGKPTALPSKIGATNGVQSEVLNPEIQPGMQLLIDYSLSDASR